jgi:hypothetical protein
MASLLRRDLLQSAAQNPYLGIVAVVLAPTIAHAQTATLVDGSDPTGPVAMGPLTSQPPCRSPACHDGLYLRVTTGAGLGYVVGRGPSSPDDYRVGLIDGSVAIGGTPVRTLVVGALLHVTTGGLSDNGVAAMVDWYPSVTEGWHLGLDAGLTLLTTRAGTADGTGWGPVAGIFAGYDWWVRGFLSIGVQLSGSAGTLETMRNSNNVDMGYKLAPLELSLSISALFH